MRPFAGPAKFVEYCAICAFGFEVFLMLDWSSRFLVIFTLLQGVDTRAEAVATYLANAGVMIANGETKILFDPLFRNDYGLYQLVPLNMEDALMSGRAPFDGVDAVFISHAHGDHFSAGDVLAYLRGQPGVQLFLPEEAALGMDLFLPDANDEIRGRMSRLDLGYGDDAVSFRFETLIVEAFHIPHSGWPDRQPAVQNLAWRVTMDDAVTVLHLGDADTSPVHFQNDEDQWSGRHTDAAFPPYWFFTSAKGSDVMVEYIKPDLAIGVHVPERWPPDHSASLEEHVLFTLPGEYRSIP